MTGSGLGRRGRRVLLGAAAGTSSFAVLSRRPPRPRLPRREEGPLLAAVALAAVVEEAAWRWGVLRTVLRLAGPVPAVGVSAFGFAAAHRPSDGCALGAYVLLGGAFGCAALGGGTIVAAAAAHVVYDVLVVLDRGPGAEARAP